MHVGSIPACAGEPPASDRTLSGLSPRVRGNLGGEHRHRLHIAGSIPACAGEPDDGHSASKCWVYPRVCGGTMVALAVASAQMNDTEVYPRVCGGT